MLDKKKPFSRLTSKIFTSRSHFLFHLCRNKCTVRYNLKKRYVKFETLMTAGVWKVISSSIKLLIMMKSIDFIKWSSTTNHAITLYLLHYSSIFSPIRIVRYSIWNYCCKDFGKVKMIVLGLILIIGQRKMLFMSLWFRPRTTPKLLYYYKTYWKSIMRKRCQNVCHPSWRRPHSFENTYIVCNIDHSITLRIEYRK